MKFKYISILIVFYFLTLTIVRCNNQSPTIWVNNDDTHLWLKMSTYIETQSNRDKILPHNLLTPTAPILSVTISKLLNLPIKNAYLFINLESAFLSSILLFLIASYFFSVEIAFISSFLHLTSFQTQKLLVAIIPEQVIHFFILSTIYSSIRIIKSKHSISSWSLIIKSIIFSLGVLTKTSLVFLYPLFPLSIYIKNKRTWIKNTIIFSIPIFLILFPYYLFVWQQFQTLPWTMLTYGYSSPVEEIQRYGPLYKNNGRIIIFFSTYLHAMPWFFFGLMNTKLKTFKEKYLWFIFFF